ncbi:hypothetical protein HPB52_000064 [Rhipicephalus sanguineus]|uniref:Uncharacterized protein n=1 Tax=Rhipicephalus sanguineus TaxID=34632 RepID=A0A9D4Q3Z9_RHISA|nr:hypothetical protein HPB52_000064 [Rhipicephalus sanguineus]
MRTTVIGEAYGLEELELECASSSDSCAEFPTALAALVRASPFLVSLSLSGISMEEQATKHLLVSLTESGILKDLTLDGRYSAAALERICKRHAELLEDLAELVEVSVAEIAGMAHRHLQKTASLDEYMRITGVVKERVVCHPREDGRVQLDDLGEVCWQMVRRFLMLDDVEEVVTHPDNL